MYSYITKNCYNGKACKGVKKYNKKTKQINHKKCEDTFMNKDQMVHQMSTITRRERHKVGSYKLNILSLSCFGDKRYILDDGITTLVYGNKKKNK